MITAGRVQENSDGDLASAPALFARVQLARAAVR